MDRNSVGKRHGMCTFGIFWAAFISTSSYRPTSEPRAGFAEAAANSSSSKFFNYSPVRLPVIEGDRTAQEANECVRITPNNPRYSEANAKSQGATRKFT